MHARTERNRPAQAYRPVAGRSGSAWVPYKITRSSWPRSQALAGVSSSMSNASNTIARATCDLAIQRASPFRESKGGKKTGGGAATGEIKLYRDHTGRAPSWRNARRYTLSLSFSLRYICEPLPSRRRSSRSERIERFSERRREAKERQKHAQRSAKGRKDEEPKRSRRESEETIARRCVKNEDIQMEI